MLDVLPHRAHLCGAHVAWLWTFEPLTPDLCFGIKLGIFCMLGICVNDHSWSLKIFKI